MRFYENHTNPWTRKPFALKVFLIFKLSRNVESEYGYRSREIVQTWEKKSPDSSGYSDFNALPIGQSNSFVCVCRVSNNSHKVWSWFGISLVYGLVRSAYRQKPRLSNEVFYQSKITFILLFESPWNVIFDRYYWGICIHICKFVS